MFYYYLVPKDTKFTFEKLNLQLNVRTPYQTCISNSDCNNDEKCFQNKCYPTFRGTNYCNPLTGTWVLEDLKGKQYLKCTCLYPNIVSQKFEGANCDLDIACPPFGQLNSIFIQDMSEARCICKKGYKSVTTPRLGCEKFLPSEVEKSVCDSDEIHISQASNVFHSEYLNNLPAAKRCLKNPCSYNIFNGEPLLNTKFDSKYGCVCNPTYGNFGIKFDSQNLGKYLITDGYDACANIFKSPPKKSISIHLFTYFYINGDKPVSFIQFSNLSSHQLIPELQRYVKNKNLQVSEIWPYNFSQYIFENEWYMVHTRECFLVTFFQIEECHERIMKWNHTIECDKIIDTVNENTSNRHFQTYALLYKYPVCKYTSSEFSDLYKNWHILNPYFLSFKEYPQLARSNGIEMFYATEMSRWEVSLAKSEFEKYESTSVYPILKPLFKPKPKHVTTVVGPMWLAR